MKPYIVDFDDLCDNTADELEQLCALKARLPLLKVTLFTIPARTSDDTIEKVREINALALENWIQLAPHGWRHTRGECLSWTDEEAELKIVAAREKGIDAPVFRAPAWLIDAHTYEACKRLNYAVASHDEFRVPNTGVREYIYNHRVLHRNRFTGIHGHLTPVMGNYIRDMVRQGKFELDVSATYAFPQDMAEVIL